MRILAILSLLLAPVGLPAQSKPAIEVTSVRLGFPAGPFTVGGQPAFKAGAFAPVFVDLHCHAAVEGALTLTVETADGTDLLHSYQVPLPPLNPGDTLNGIELPNLPYTKPGSTFTDLKVTVHAGERTVGQPFSETYIGVDPRAYLILTAGTQLKSFRLPYPTGTAEEQRTEAYLGLVELTSAMTIGELPDQWFGYQAIDVMILPTGNAELIEELSSPRNRTRQDALIEWVRRGGEVILSVGRNADLVAQLGELQGLLPAEIGLTQRQSELRLNWTPRASTVPERETLNAPEDGDIPIATLTPKTDRSTMVLMQDESGSPLVVRAAYGMGRVTLVAFDLDRPPFTEWKTPGGLWKWLLGEAAGTVPEGEPTARDQGSYFFSSDTKVFELQRTLEFFEGIPVISFGWVALFILLYIVIIGPLDYLFLKKVVKRMEWTWITFPIIVIIVSAAAYFTAYALKGEDLKVNKIDLVDIDLQSDRVYGTSWFTVFSPRIDNYNIGIEPASPTWSATGSEQSADDVLVTWLGDLNQGTRSVFRRSYQYHVDANNEEYANGLNAVPIQVWSTKAMMAEWEAAHSAHRLIEADLRHPAAEPESLDGFITNNLPVDVLEDVQLIYRGKMYDLGTLVRGNRKQIVLHHRPNPPADWLLEQSGLTDENLSVSYSPQPTADIAAQYRLWPVLFADAMNPAGTTEPGLLSRWDQSWRLHDANRDEAILLARVPTQEGPGEEMMTRDPTPTRLWLHELPGSGIERQPLAGTLRQETYLRIFIPIAPVETTP